MWCWKRVPKQISSWAQSHKEGFSRRRAEETTLWEQTVAKDRGIDDPDGEGSESPEQWGLPIEKYYQIRHVHLDFVLTFTQVYV